MFSLVNSIRIKFTMFLMSDFYFKRRVRNHGDKIILFMKNIFLKRTFVGKNHTLPCATQQHPVCFQRSFIMEGGPVVIYQGEKRSVQKFNYYLTSNNYMPLN